MTNYIKTSSYSNSSLLLRFLCVITFFIIGFHFKGENPKMAIESFEPLDTDITSLIEGSTKYDQNGEKCALIKIQTVEHGFMFDVGSLGIVEVVEQNAEHPGEIWLYVPNGVKSITIQHPQFGTINDFDLGGRVKKGKTYLLKLTSDQVNTLVVDYNNSQILKTHINPQSATFYLNGMIQKLDDNGTSEIPLSFGTYTYRATAEDYHLKEGKITINNKYKKHELNINLKPAFGYLSIDGSNDLDSAYVYVDDKMIGQVPLVNAHVKSGNHNLIVKQKLYLPYSEEFAITDSAFIKIKPTLISNYADVYIKVANTPKAQIFADGEYLGQGFWKGKLEVGSHQLEARMDKHDSSVKEVDISKGQNFNIELQAPIPIPSMLEENNKSSNIQDIITKQNISSTSLQSQNNLIGYELIEGLNNEYNDPSKNAKFYFNEGKKLFNAFDKDLINRMINSASADNLKMGQELLNGFGNFLKALHESERINGNGNLDSKTKKTISTTLKGHVNDYFTAGADFFNAQKMFPEAYECFMIYADMPEQDFMKDNKLELPAADRGTAYFNAGLAAYSGNEIYKSADAFRKARGVGYDDKQAYIYEIACWQVATQRDPTIEQTAKEKIMEVADAGYKKYGIEEPLFINNVVNILVSDEKFEQAIAIVNELIAANLENAGLYGLRGFIYDKMKKDEDSVNDYKKAASLNNVDFETLKNATKIIYRVGGDKWDAIEGNSEEARAARLDVRTNYFEAAKSIAVKAKAMNSSDSDLDYLIENIDYALSHAQ